LGLAEAKDLLAAVQDTLVTAQVSAAVAARDTCPDCATPYRHKDKHTIVVRQPVRHAAPGQPPLVALRLPTPDE
jgi:hypothetical protein